MHMTYQIRFATKLTLALLEPSHRFYLIITHIGSVKRFVDRGSLVFQSKRTGDYHEDMNADVLEEYFDQMLSLLPENSVIVMDNASYHSRHLENLPRSSWKKSDIAIFKCFYHRRSSNIKKNIYTVN
ncbi:hypothetical protein PPYR_01343 [Photinus pyralis]|uniref:Tc1-like transposase DDE domain-containing protein n=1 Tax=Photinus pyralis TaxID=7054 RepID=A0A5N4B497_PHOPY|nr:hypothetical protein PPYR_01343 [Photinus pyralis]